MSELPEYQVPHFKLKHKGYNFYFYRMLVKSVIKTFPLNTSWDLLNHRYTAEDQALSSHTSCNNVDILLFFNMQIR
uniref:Uncharacterized protein n=1 Tax=Calidris pygmaea TaxID=425635 RepID=A0A8C3PJ52_9CHAR